MSANPCPNEKTCEELFLIYAFMRVYRLYSKRMIIYAPTLHEEKSVGYDAKADIGCRELYIQFKRAHPNNASKDRLCFDVNPHQLDTLKKNYPLYSAFYVVGSFNDTTQLNKHQNNLNLPNFLNQYIAIPVHCVDGTTQQVHFCRLCHQNKRSYCKHDVTLPSLVNGHSHSLVREKPLYEWFYGDEILREFVNNRFGATISVTASGEIIREHSEFIRSMVNTNPIPNLVRGMPTDEFRLEDLQSDQYAPTSLRLC